MNQIVSRWNAAVARPKISGPDILTIDDEQVIIGESDMAPRTRSKSEKKPHKNLTDLQLAREGSKSVAVNKHAVVGLALYGSGDRAAALLLQTKRTVERLGIRWKKVVPFKSAPKGVGGQPSIRDVIRWLDSLTKDQADAIAFLRRLHKTVVLRLA